MKKMIAAVVLFGLVGCTDSCISQLATYGEIEHITCFSGGVMIYDGYSTGIVEKSSSDFFYLRDRATGKFVAINGDCIVRHEAPHEEK